MGLRLITAGESHGPELTCVVEGIKGGREDAVVDELVGLYELANK